MSFPEFTEITVRPFEKKVEFISVSKREQELNQVLLSLHLSTGLFKCSKLISVRLVIPCLYSFQCEHWFDRRLKVLDLLEKKQHNTDTNI